MDINYIGIPVTVAFSELKQGALFRDEDCKGLFMKTGPESAVIIQVSGPRTGTRAGESSGWDKPAITFPVRAIDVHLVQ